MQANQEGLMSSRADILTAAQRAMNTHHPAATGGCAECKTTWSGPCHIWVLAEQVFSLVQDHIRSHPPATIPQEGSFLDLSH